MKIRDLSTDYISTLGEDDLSNVKWKVKHALTGSRKTLKLLQTKPLTTERQAREYGGIRRSNAHQEALLEAIMCREDVLYGPGVLSTYNHSISGF